MKKLSKKEMRKLCKNFRDTLKLWWDVEYLEMPSEQCGGTCRCSVNMKAAKHTIVIPTDGWENFGFRMASICHEHCHAHITERVGSSLFSQLTFDKKFWELEGDEKEAYRKKMEYVHASWLHIDIWIDTLRHRHWPEITEREEQEFISDLYGILRHAGTDHPYIQSLEGILAVAVHKAEAIRLGYRDQISAEEIWKGRALELVTGLTKLYASFPEIKFQAGDQKILLDSMNQVAAFMGYDIVMEIKNDGEEYIVFE